MQNCKFIYDSVYRFTYTCDNQDPSMWEWINVRQKQIMHYSWH